MTKENAHEYLPFVQALAEGETIELMTFGGQWIPLKEISFDFPCERYRIKPEKKLVPFTWDDRDLLMGKWIMNKKDNISISMIITVHFECISISNDSFYYDELLESFTFLDGSPCGKEIEE